MGTQEGKWQDHQPSQRRCTGWGDCPRGFPAPGFAVGLPSFSEALRRALRQDPDIILVGELRDLVTIEAAVTAAETGPVPTTLNPKG